MFIGRRAAACIAASNDRVAQATRDSARQVAESNDRMSRTLRENSEIEVAARDRVNITLAEYTRMKDTIANLSDENSRLVAFFRNIGLPIDAPIVPNSVHKLTCCDVGGPFDFTQRFLVEFRCDVSGLSPEQRRQLTDGYNQR